MAHSKRLNHKEGGGAQRVNNRVLRLFLLFHDTYHLMEIHLKFIMMLLTYIKMLIKLNKFKIFGYICKFIETGPFEFQIPL